MRAKNTVGHRSGRVSASYLPSRLGELRLILTGLGRKHSKQTHSELSKTKKDIMAPAANTKQRRGRGAATIADSDSDLEYQVYNGRLREASAARARLKKVCILVESVKWLMSS